MLLIVQPFYWVKYLTKALTIIVVPMITAKTVIEIENIIISP